MCDVKTIVFFFVSLPETNSEFTPENGWLEDDRFLLGAWDGLFSGTRERCFYPRPESVI